MYFTKNRNTFILPLTGDDGGGVGVFRGWHGDGSLDGGPQRVDVCGARGDLVTERGESALELAGVLAEQTPPWGLSKQLLIVRL